MFIHDLDDKADVRGDTYGYLLAKIAFAGRNGQFRTPRHIIKMMVELMKPRPDDTICEIIVPSKIKCAFCGSLW